MKSDKKTITIIFLAVTLLLIGGIYAKNIIEENAYSQGVQDSNLFLNQQITNELNTNGYITFNYPVNETTLIPIKLGVMQ